MNDPYQAPSAVNNTVLPSKKLTMKEILFSMNGRIPRSTWWLYSLLTPLALMLPLGLIAYLVPALAIVFIVAYPVMIWIQICLSAKRCHDSDKSGWFQLIPIYNFILCGFIPGTPGSNRFGNNPLGQ